MAKHRALVLLLGVVAFVLAGASLPHLHASGDFGLWNEEHDLGLMATPGNAASQPDAAPVVALVVALVLALVPRTVRPASAPLRLSEPRAPPIR
jgi:hypothetical protein